MYKVFSRTWWRDNPRYPNGLEPHAGRKRVIKARVDDESTAREICRQWNSRHKPGRYSLKAEYEEV